MLETLAIFGNVQPQLQPHISTLPIAGGSPTGYVCEVLERDSASCLEGQSSGVPFKTGRGMFAKYEQAPSPEEIDANRADMFQNFGEHF